MSFRRPSPSTRLRVAARTDAGRVPMTNEDSFVVADLSVPITARMPLPPPRPAEEPARERWKYQRHALLAPPAPVAVSLESAGAVLAVLDGMGGSCMGDVAARIAADTFAAELTREPPSGEDACCRRLADAMNAASRAILGAVAEGPLYYQGMGAAALLAVVSGDRLHLAGAGLCRAYILRGGRLSQVTRDDSLRNDYLAHIGAGGHAEFDISEVPPNILTKALGLQETVDLRPSTFELCAGDVVLFCTDGLHGQVDEPSIARVLLDLTEPAEAALALVNLANARGGADNVAVVVARPETDGMRRPGPEDALESRNIP